MRCTVLPLEAAAVGVFAWSAPVFTWVVHVKVIFTLIPGPKISQQNEKINVIHLLVVLILWLLTIIWPDHWIGFTLSSLIRAKKKNLSVLLGWNFLVDMKWHNLELLIWKQLLTIFVDSPCLSFDIEVGFVSGIIYELHSNLLSLRKWWVFST